METYIAGHEISNQRKRKKLPESNDETFNVSPPKTKKIKLVQSKHLIY